MGQHLPTYLNYLNKIKKPLADTIGGGALCYNRPDQEAKISKKTLLKNSWAIF